MQKLLASITCAAALSTLAVSGESISTGSRLFTNVTSASAQIVTCRPEVDLDALIKELGLQPRFVYRHALQGFSASITPGTINTLKQDSRIRTVEPDGKIVVSTQTNGLGIIRMGLTNFPIAHINGGDHRINVDVAVMDTGIQTNHPDLNVVKAVGLADPGLNGDDWDGHGTHAAGIIGALDNGFGVVGVAPGVRLWSVQVIGPTQSDWANFLAGCDYIATNADKIAVANASLGGDGQTIAPQVAIRQAISNLVSRGIVFITSAGNFGIDVYGGDGIRGNGDDILPASLPEAMTISAMNPTNNKMAVFSNFSSSDAGSDTHVFSPGKAIDVAAPGINILSTYTSNRYALMSGTSMAAPHAAGLVALYIAANGRGHTVQDVYRIRQTLVNAGQPQSAWPTQYTFDPDGNPEPLAFPSESWVPMPMIASETKTQGGFQLSFPAVPGYSYTAQYRTSLPLSTNWTNLSTITGTGSVSTATITDPTPSPFRIYRLARQPSP
jgi:subtilisin family serine protease